MLEQEDTIAAIATPSGRGGVGVVRISGPMSHHIARAILDLERELTPRHASLHDFYAADGAVIDRGIVLYFKASASFTGEDVVELQGHGGPVVMDMLLQTTLSHGARLARPGEFSERAFLNGMIDLAQANSQRIDALVHELISLRSYVEAAIDFVDEEIDFLSDGQVGQRLALLLSAINEIQLQAQQGVLLRDGMKVVIAGPPNAGKSSLLNYLAGTDTAIVTEQAGTTRDVLREQINIDGLPLHIIDTAGLRDSEDLIEQMGIQRAKHEIQAADLVLLVFDISCRDTMLCQDMLATVPDTIDVVIVWNKIDLTGLPAQRHAGGKSPEVFVSVTQGQGMELLTAQLKDCAGFHPGSEDSFIARRRHLEALAQAAGHLIHGGEQLQRDQAAELLAEDLRLAQQALAQITGTFTSDDLLTNIFSSFCIGK